MNWISVKDRLPDSYGDSSSKPVLATDNKCVYIGYYNFHHNSWRYYDDFNSEVFENVTHWMPLPKLPKE